MKQRNLEIQWRRTIISEADFKETLSYLETIDGLHPYSPYYRNIKQGLLISAIVAYARPFLDSKGDDASHRLPGNHKSILKGSERDLHQQLIDLRCKAAAHSDSYSKPVGHLGFPRAGGHSTLYTPIGVVLDSANLKTDDFKNLAFRMMMFCKKKAMELASKIRES